eukprot:scaffold4865_cov281-Prasinococcus_capsulatus_cf.AAC.1
MLLAMFKAMVGFRCFGLAYEEGYFTEASAVAAGWRWTWPRQSSRGDLCMPEVRANFTLIESNNSNPKSIPTP